MSRKIVFEASAFNDFNEWSSKDKKIYQKIVKLIKEIDRSPFTGIGKPEPLKYQLSGYWSRRINDEHRLVYQVTDTDEAQTLVKNLIQMIEEGRLEVRIYTKGRLHAKAYIFDYGKVYDQNGNLLERNESHNLRNLGTQRYRIVETFLASGKQCCFLTATPRNKTAWDIYNQIKLFHQEEQTNLPVDPPHVKQYFQKVEKGERQLQNLLSHILIRRTRNHILRWYGYDSETHTPVDPFDFEKYLQGKRRAYIHVAGNHCFFPKRELGTIEYSIETTYQGLYQQLRGYLGKSRTRQKKKSSKNELCYARYGLGNYVVKSKRNQEPYISLQSAGANLRGLMRVLLFKRFESSVYAFRKTVQRLLKTYQYFDRALEEGFIPVGEDAETILHNQGNTAEEADILQQLKQVSDKYLIEDFQHQSLHRDIQHDLKLLETILELVEPITPDQDTKLQTLKEKLDQYRRSVVRLLCNC